MTRSEFVSYLLEDGIMNATVIISIDHTGDERLMVYLNTSVVQNIWEVPEEHQDTLDGYYVLGDCEHILWQGDSTDIAKHRKKVFSEHRKASYMKPYDCYYTLTELIRQKMKYENSL